MSKQDIVEALKNDPAFEYSVKKNDIVNMQLVLRAYKYTHTYDFAREIIDCALVCA